MLLLPQLWQIFEGDPPDLVVHDMGVHSARVLARRLGVPTLRFSTTSAPEVGHLEQTRREIAAVEHDPRVVELRRRFGGWLADNGITDTDPVDFLLDEPEQTLVLIPRCMQPRQDTVDTTRYPLVGWCSEGHSAGAGWSRPSGAARLVFISLGTIFTNALAFYRECLAAFGGRPDWHVVLQVGSHLDITGLGELPANVEVHRWVPQVSVLEVCDLFITHGGMGSCIEGLASASPMIVVPQAVDQFSNAQRLVDLRVARQMETAQVTAAWLRMTAGELLSDQGVTERLTALSKEVRAGCGSVRAADLVERCLR
jgi:MGT family glycosyltransferase